MQRNYDYIFKFVLVGSSSVGKSSILKRFADDQFQQSYISTIGIDFRFKSLMIDDNYVKLQIWDTAGQQRFRGITKSYYKGAHAIIVVYDSKNSQSFEDLKSYWLQEIKSHSQDGFIYAFANKCDNAEQEKVPEHQLQFFKEREIQLFPVSAKTGYNVTKSILQISKKMMEVVEKQPKDKSIMGLKQATPNKNTPKGCCSK